MRDFVKAEGAKEHWLMLLGTLIGGGLALLAISHLPLTQAGLTSSFVLASLVVTCAYISNPVLWWMGMGAIAGILVGLGGVMAGHLAQEKEVMELGSRLIFVSFLISAGFISGVILGRKIHKAHLPTLREFISSLSALTAGLFAVIVTIRFITTGLEPARALSSRLSASMTILITLLALPGALGYLLVKRRDVHTQSNRDRTSDHP